MLRKLFRVRVSSYIGLFLALFLALGGTSYAASGKPFIQGSGNATFGRLALEGGPPLVS